MNIYINLLLLLLLLYQIDPLAGTGILVFCYIEYHQAQSLQMYPLLLLVGRSRRGIQSIAQRKQRNPTKAAENKETLSLITKL